MMRGGLLAVALVVIVIVAAAESSAQTVTEPDLPDAVANVLPDELVDQPSSELARREDLVQWVEDFTAWKVWWARWANRHQPGWFTSSQTRREKPTPPEWLSPRCDEVVDEIDPLKPACELLSEWRTNDLAAMARYANAAAVKQQEQRSKIVWWEHVHVDMLWPATQLRSEVYGVIGVHTSATIKGRFNVFLGPGVMLLNLPAADGSRVWKMAADYGIGYRLFDFTFPGKRRASLHLNVAKSWLVSDATDLIVSKNMEFVGLSMTFKRR